MECGNVKVKYLGYLSQLAGARETEIWLCDGRRIQDIIKIDNINLEDLVILVNGRAARPQDKVKPGDSLTILPHISGG